MTPSTTTACILAFVLATGSSLVQKHPDFSGEWRPIGAPAMQAPPSGGDPPPPPRTVSVTITQTGEDLKVVRQTLSGGREATYNFSYKLDGTETVNQMGPLVFHTRASWEGAALVLASNVSVEERLIGTIREIYSLEEGKLTVQSVRTGPAGPMKNTTVHERVVRD